MKTVSLISALSGIVLAIGTTAASAENAGGWHYDEELDTIVLDFPGSRDKYISSSTTAHAETPGAESEANWYYNEDDDTIVLNFPGSRDKYLANSELASSETAKMEHKMSWYVDNDEEYES